MLDIIAIILLSITLVTLIVLLILLLNRKPSSSSLDLKEIGSLSNQIQNISNNVNKDLQIALEKYTKSSSEDNNSKLERFNLNINDAINKRFDSLTEQMNKRIDDLNKKVDQKLNEGFINTNNTMKSVNETLGRIDEAQRNLAGLSNQVVSLKQVLEGNQTRGQYGEYQLSMVLHNVFGDTIGCYKEQYQFKKVVEGEKVRADAVVFMPEPNKMICIDSKFPFQQYSKLFDAEKDEDKNELLKLFASDVKKHITAIANKYIIQNETAQEAIMFIPNDGVFAFIHHNLEETVNYAREKRVILTSPSTLPAILVTINMVNIETERAKNAELISKDLQMLAKDFQLFGKEWDNFSTAIDKATSSKDVFSKRVGRLSNKFDALKSSDVEQLEDSDNIQIENK